MSEKKNYLDNDELKEELLKCITIGYNQALKFGYVPRDDSDSESEENVQIDPEALNAAIELGYVPERSECIRMVKAYDPDETELKVKSGKMTREDADILSKQMEKPVVSDKLARMFQLMVDNVSRSFYWQNPDDGLDCKANSLLDLCSNFWKFAPADAVSGKPNSAFAFCTQIAYFGIAGAHRILHPKKYEGTISMSCLDENGKLFELYNL